MENPFSVYWDEYVIFILPVVNMVYHIKWFANIKKKTKKQVRGPDLGLRPPVHRPQTQTSSGSACLRAGTQPSPPGSGQRSAALCSPLWAMRHWNIAFYFFITIKKVYLLLLKFSCYTILYKLQCPIQWGLHSGSHFLKAMLHL